MTRKLKYAKHFVGVTMDGVSCYNPHSFSRKAIRELGGIDGFQGGRIFLMTTNSFQRRVSDWLKACFPLAVYMNQDERMHRFLEEALELAQAVGCSKQDAYQLVDYVFSREIGQPDLEVGGVMVTLAGLCSAAGIDMSAAGDRELTRNWSRIEAIRRKQACKPEGSPLPQKWNEQANVDTVA